MSDVSEGFFPEKYKLLIFEAQNGICGVEGCYKPIEEFHHMVPNTVANRRLFPIFIRSPFNMFGICRPHHQAGDRPKIKYGIAEVYEEYLNDLKKGNLND